MRSVDSVSQVQAKPWKAPAGAALCALALWLAAPLVHAADADRTLIAGERAGPIKAGMTRAELEQAIDAPISFETRPGPEGTDPFDVALIAAGTADAAEVEFSADGTAIRVVVTGTGWQTENGLKVGMSLAELEQRNGVPIEFLGFAWDNGGAVTGFMDGALQESLMGISLWLNYPGTPPRALTGDVFLNSTVDGLDKQQVRIERMRVDLVGL